MPLVSRAWKERPKRKVNTRRVVLPIGKITIKKPVRRKACSLAEITRQEGARERGRKEVRGVGEELSGRAREITGGCERENI